MFKRMWYTIVAILVVVTLLAGCVTRDCGECLTTQGLSHMSGPINLTGAGTAAAPAFYLNSDSDTGIYQSAANNWDIAVAGSNVVNVSASGVAFTGGQTFTLGAAERVQVDGASTVNTGTAGVFDVDHASITANAAAVYITSTTNTGAATGADSFGMVMTLTQDDADADKFGISINAAATTNAAAGSYEAGLVYDCAENTAGACLDGVRLTAGTATGMTDGFDASDADIVNAVNIGVNPILGSNADTLFLGLTDHHLTLTGDEAAAVTFIGADDSGAADTVFDTTGAGTATLGSADVATVAVRGIAVDVDVTGGISFDGDLASNWSAAAGDITIDAEAASVNIIGSEANAAAIYLDANDTVTSGVDVDTGTTSGLTIDGGPFSVDGTGAFNINTASGDITVEAETGSVTLKGDEGAGDAIHLDADETALGGVTIAANTGGVDVNLTAAGPFAVDGDLFVVGNAGADGDVADADNDALIVGVLEVDGEIECDGTMDIDAATTAMTMTIGTDGVGQDVTFNSLTAGDALLWDASDVALEITGTSAQNALEVAEGNLAVTLGNATIAAGSFDVTLGSTTVETMTVGVDAGGRDMTWHSLTASDLMLWDSSAVCLDITGTDSQNSFRVLDGDVSIVDDVTVTTGNVAVSVGTFDVTAGATTVETTTIGVDGVGADVTFHSLTASDAMLWDASDVALEITGTSAQNALEVAEGDFAVTLGDAAISAGAFDVTAGATTVETMTIGADGVGADVTFHSLTASDAFLWDASDVALEITGTSAQNALEVAEGDLTVTLGDVAVSAGAFDVTAGATTVETMTVGVSGTGADVIFHSLTGADELTWDASAAALLVEGTDGQTSLDVVDGNLALADEFVLGTGATISVTNATNMRGLFVSEASFTQAISETATTMFVIPANVNIVDVTFEVSTVWNDGASAVVDCGISGGDLDAYVDNHNVNDGTDYNRCGDNGDMPFASALGDVGGSDVTVVCQVALGTGDQTTGDATLRIWWAID